METLRKTSLFWDIEPGGLSPESHWFFIIERILEFGDIDDLRWMKKHFTPGQDSTLLPDSYHGVRKIFGEDDIAPGGF